MWCPEPQPTPGAGALELDAADLPEMLDLVRRSRPGPFGPRTPELGRHVGVREGGRLATAGERLRPEGCCEVSAVCTDPNHRGRGHARALVSELLRGIAAKRRFCTSWRTTRAPSGLTPRWAS